MTSYFLFKGWFSIKQDLLINEQIRFKMVQVIGENGEKLGKMTKDEALDIAEAKKLDLVLVSSNPENPVCRIMNYGKHKFEQSKREKESKKKQKEQDALDEEKRQFEAEQIHEDEVQRFQVELRNLDLEMDYIGLLLYDPRYIVSYNFLYD